MLGLEAISPFWSSRRLIADVVGFTGEIVTDPSKPDGTPRKLLDIKQACKSRVATRRSGSKEGLASTYRWFASQFRERVRAIRAQSLLLTNRL